MVRDGGRDFRRVDVPTPAHVQAPQVGPGVGVEPRRREDRRLGAVEVRGQAQEREDRALRQSAAAPEVHRADLRAAARDGPNRRVRDAQEWDVNAFGFLRFCCCRNICDSCNKKLPLMEEPCPLCRTPPPRSMQDDLARLRRHVENDVPEAITYLGHAYLDGDLGLVKSSKKAVKLFKRSVERGDLRAMCALAQLYINGDGIKSNRQKAIQLYRIAADRGSALAQCNLGSCYTQQQKFADAFPLYRLAAEQGYREAEFNLANCYGDGRGVEKDLDAAEHWYERAAAKGDTDAEYALGLLFMGRAEEDKEGIVEHVQAGMRWFKSAAAKGHQAAGALMVDWNKDMARKGYKL